MKKVILSSLVAIFALAAQAQNVQLHYDFGRNIYSDEEAGRQKVTLTLEQFKADRFGSWYYFVDFDKHQLLQHPHLFSPVLYNL